MSSIPLLMTKVCTHGRDAALAGDGHLEKFKTTRQYDGDTGREQHGYPPARELPL